MWLIQAGETGECLGLYKAPALAAQTPGSLQQGSPHGFRLSRFQWIPGMSECTGRSLLWGWSFQGREGLQWLWHHWWFALSPLSQAHLTFWDHPPRFLFQCSPAVVCALSADAVPWIWGFWHGGCKSRRAMEVLCMHWVAGYMDKCFINSGGPGNTGEQWHQTSALLCLAYSLFLFRTELFPASTPPFKLTDTTHRYLMGPRGDLGPCLHA